MVFIRHQIPEPVFISHQKHLQPNDFNYAVVVVWNGLPDGFKITDDIQDEVGERKAMCQSGRLYRKKETSTLYNIT